MQKKYTVLWKYTSSLGGPWAEGEVVELDEQLAGRINIDSPGVLEEQTEQKKPNRMVKRASGSRKSGG